MAQLRNHIGDTLSSAASANFKQAPTRERHLALFFEKAPKVSVSALSFLDKSC